MDGETGLKNDPVTITAPPAQVTVDPQNPLPEPNFFWRRVLAIIVTSTVLALTWRNLDALHDLRDPKGLLALAKWTLALDALVLTYYFVAPSASELTNMIQSAKIIRSSITLGQSAQQAGNQPAQPLSAPAAASPPPDPLGRVPAPVSGDEEDAAPRGRTDV